MRGSTNPRCAVVCADDPGTGRIRIAYVDATGEMGGAEHLLLTLLAGAAQIQVEPLFICSQEGPFPERVRQLGVPSYVFKIPRLFSFSPRIRGIRVVNPLAIAWDLCVLLGAAWRTVRFLRPRHPSLVQTNSVLAHIYGGIAARCLKVPCVWYFHDLVETERLLGFTVLVWRVLARLLGARVVAVSHAVARSLRLGERTAVIHSGVQPAPSAPGLDTRARLGLSPQAQLLGYVGRICYGKGLDTLAFALQRTLSIRPDVHVVLFGAPLFGEIQVERRLRELLERLGIAAHWHWMGYDPHAAARMSELSLLVLPTRREALPLALVEAAMAGIPVVASHVGGVPEVVVDGETGILVPPDDPDALASAILRLLADPQLARALGSQAQERALRLFSLEEYYARFRRFYALLAGQSLDEVRRAASSLGARERP